MARPVRVKGCRNEVKESEHGERRGEHGIVHRRGVAGEGLVDHVTDEGHDQQSPYELAGVSLAYSVEMQVEHTCQARRPI